MEPDIYSGHLGTHPGGLLIQWNLYIMEPVCSGHLKKKPAGHHTEMAAYLQWSQPATIYCYGRWIYTKTN